MTNDLHRETTVHTCSQIGYGSLASIESANDTI
jgi:hypothetical protein